MRLIDADALDKDLRKYAERKAAGGHIEIASGVLSAAERIRQCAPTVDAVPVVHGHWIKQEGFITEYKCSVCQHSDSKLTAIRGHYCWYCGAKMDKENV